MSATTETFTIIDNSGHISGEYSSDETIPVRGHRYNLRRRRRAPRRYTDSYATNNRTSRVKLNVIKVDTTVSTPTPTPISSAGSSPAFTLESSVDSVTSAADSTAPAATTNSTTTSTTASFVFNGPLGVIGGTEHVLQMPTNMKDNDMFVNGNLVVTRLDLGPSTENDHLNDSLVIQGKLYYTGVIDIRENIYPLHGFTITTYGRGYLLRPPTPEHSTVGTKYFYNTWWMPKKDAWFFRTQELANLEQLGAVIIIDM